MIRFLFWIAVIVSLIYFSGDIKFRDQSLKTWVSGFLDGTTAKTKVDTGSGLLRSLNTLINPDTGLSDAQLKQVKTLIDDRLTTTDRTSLNQLMKALNESEKESEEEEKKDDQAPKSEPKVSKADSTETKAKTTTAPTATKSKSSKSQAQSTQSIAKKEASTPSKKSESEDKKVTSTKK